MVFMGGRNLTPLKFMAGQSPDLMPVMFFIQNRIPPSHATDEGCDLTYFTEFPPRPTPHGFHGGLDFDPPWFPWGVGC